MGKLANCYGVPDFLIEPHILFSTRNDPARGPAAEASLVLRYFPQFAYTDFVITVLRSRIGVKLTLIVVVVVVVIEKMGSMGRIIDYDNDNDCDYEWTFWVTPLPESSWQSLS